MGCLTVFPEIFPVVEVAGYRDAQSVCRLYRFQAYVGGTFGYGWRDTCPVKPRGIFEYLVPIDHPRLDLGDGRMNPIIYHLAGTSDRSGLQKINA